MFMLGTDDLPEAVASLLYWMKRKENQYRHDVNKVTTTINLECPKKLEIICGSISEYAFNLILEQYFCAIDASVKYTVTENADTKKVCRNPLLILNC